MRKQGRKIIAEIGSVHDGSFGNALKLIEAASYCGSDIVKFQLHLPEEEMADNAPNPPYFNEESRFDYFKRILFSTDQLEKILKFCKKKKIEFLCSPFSNKAVDILNEIGVQNFKIASGEVTNHPLLKKINKKRCQVFLSSGMSNWNELDEAVKILKNNNLVVMQCTSLYPCPIEMVGLNNICEIKKRYGTMVGFSDHYKGMEASISAATLGADFIEKHFTFSKLMYGSDAKFAMEPKNFKKFCEKIKNVWRMIDNPVDKNNLTKLKKMKETFEKSIFLSRDIKKGQVIKYQDLSFKKPGDGISASKYMNIIGKKLKKNQRKNQKLKYSDFINDK